MYTSYNPTCSQFCQTHGLWCLVSAAEKAIRKCHDDLFTGIRQEIIASTPHHTDLWHGAVESDETMFRTAVCEREIAAVSLTSSDSFYPLAYPARAAGKAEQP